MGNKICRIIRQKVYYDLFLIFPLLLFVYCKSEDIINVKFTYPSEVGLESNIIQANLDDPLSSIIEYGYKELGNVLGSDFRSYFNIYINMEQITADYQKFAIRNFLLPKESQLDINFTFTEEIKNYLISGNDIESNINQKIPSTESEFKADVADDKGSFNNTSNGVLIFRFLPINSDMIISPSELPSAVTVTCNFPLSFKELMNLIKQYTDNTGYLIESIGNKDKNGVNKLDEIQIKGEDTQASVRNGEILYIYVSNDPSRQLGGKITPNPDSPENFLNISPESEISNKIPVMISFSNFVNQTPEVFFISPNEDLSTLVEFIIKIKNLNNEKVSITFQDQTGTVLRNNGVFLSEYLPKGAQFTTNSPFHIFVSIYKQDENLEGLEHIQNIKNKESVADKYEEGNLISETSMSTPKDSEKKQFSTSFNKEHPSWIDESVSNIPINTSKELAIHSLVTFLYTEENVSLSIENDPAIATIASLYAQAQIFWASLKSKKHKTNFALYFISKEDDKKELLNPNSQNLLISSTFFSQDIILELKPVKFVSVDIILHLVDSDEKEDPKFTNAVTIKIPEIISVLDFLNMLYSSEPKIFSMIVVKGIEVQLGTDKVMEYLQFPDSPSPTTYINLVEAPKSSKNIVINVSLSRDIKVILLVNKQNLIGILEDSNKDLDESSDFTEEKQGKKYMKIKVKAKSGMTCKKFIDSFVKRQLISTDDPNDVFLQQPKSHNYVRDNAILEHLFSLEDEGEQNLTFIVKIIPKYSIKAEFQTPQGKKYPMPVVINLQRITNLGTLQSAIKNKAIERGLISEKGNVVIASPMDIGEEYRKFVYSIPDIKNSVGLTGFVPGDIIRAILVPELELNTNKNVGLNSKLQSPIENTNKKVPNPLLAKLFQTDGPSFDIPLTIKNCPLNTLLEQRYFIAKVPLFINVNSLKLIVDDTASLGGIWFSLKLNTDKGNIDLINDNDMLSDLGFTETSILIADCKLDKATIEKSKTDISKKLLKERSIAQVMVEDSCSLGNSGLCDEPSGEILDIALKHRSNLEQITDESPFDDISDENIQNRKKVNEETFRDFQKFFGLVKKYERKELSNPENKLLINSIIKKEIKDIKKNELSYKKIDNLLTKLLQKYALNDEKGILEFSETIEPEQLSQLFEYMDTPEGKSHIKKISKRLANKLAGDKRKNLPIKDKSSIIYSKARKLNSPSNENIKSYKRVPQKHELKSSKLLKGGQMTEDDHLIPNIQDSTESSGNLAPQIPIKRFQSIYSNTGKSDLRIMNNFKKKKSKNLKSRVMRALKKIPFITSRFYNIYRRVTPSHRKKKKRAKKFVDLIKKYEMIFRERAYGDSQQTGPPEAPVTPLVIKQIRIMRNENQDLYSSIDDDEDDYDDISSLILDNRVY
ncbi:hypothetical protein cand_033820 [Cryptosporidium andersoni]|uniref:Uncharacterized protein n=1 Tax=Cryptosporidium andersoni TaxID=117008 RepID=A0A1J4MZ00_9CRYT|nr:hypothetical protein cand_033820 [Cryptosporidium andersoni]